MAGIHDMHPFPSKVPVEASSNVTMMAPGHLQQQPVRLHPVERIEKHRGYRFYLIFIACVFTPIGFFFVMWDHRGSSSGSDSVADVPAMSVSNTVDFGIKESEIDQLVAMRNAHNVQPLKLDGAAEQAVTDVQPYQYGFLYGFELDDYSIRKLNISGSLYRPFEIHQLQKGQWYAIGFVGLDTYDNLTFHPRSGTFFKLYNHRWAGALRIISLPLKRVSLSNDRELKIEGEGDGLTALDCIWN